VRPDQQAVTARLAREVAAGRLEFDTAQLAAAAHLDALVADLDRGPSAWAKLALPGPLARLARGTPRGVYLWGAVGRGKTRLMDLLYGSLSLRERERDHFYVLMRSVHAELRTIAGRARPLEIVAQRIAARARLICLDEFFVSDIGDAMILTGLLNGLFRRGVAIVATSNVPPRELYADGLQRARFLPAIGMLESHMDVVHLDGAVDYRLRSLAGKRAYFDSAAAGTAADMRRLFAALATAPTGPVDVDVQGRPLAAVDTAQDAAWFEFRALCETARGANDYLDLAQRYQTMFVSDVPLFTPGREDAARRFLTLIDTLYDRGVHVVLSAAAAPEALYRGDKLALEFGRAASRLVEMQSQRYLAAPHRP